MSPKNAKKKPKKVSRTRNQTQIIYGKNKTEKLDQGLKVVINPIAAEGVGRILWPEILRKINVYYKYFDYEFTEYNGHATQITQKAILQGFSSVLVIGGKGTVKEVLRGFFNVRGKLFNPDVELLFLPLTFGSSGAAIPDKVEDWYFSMSLNKSKKTVMQPFFFHLIGYGGKKIRGSKFIFLSRFEICEKDTEKLRYKITYNDHSLAVQEGLRASVIRPIIKNRFSEKVKLIFSHKKNWHEYNWKKKWQWFIDYNKKKEHWANKVEIVSDNEICIQIDNDEYKAYGVVLYPAQEKILCNAVDID